MGRGVSYPSNCSVVCFRAFEIEDSEDTDLAAIKFDWFIEDTRGMCRECWPSMCTCDKWLDREDHAILENNHCYIGISEYCGLISIWLLSKAEDLACSGYSDSPNLADYWCSQISKKFEEMFGNLVRLGTMSNGISVYKKRKGIDMSTIDVTMKMPVLKKGWKYLGEMRLPKKDEHVRNSDGTVARMYHNRCRVALPIVVEDLPEKPTNIPIGFELAGSRPEPVKAGVWYLGIYNKTSAFVNKKDRLDVVRWVLRKLPVYRPMLPAEAAKYFGYECSQKGRTYSLFAVSGSQVILIASDYCFVRAGYQEWCDKYVWTITKEPCGILEEDKG